MGRSDAGDETSFCVSHDALKHMFAQFVKDMETQKANALNPPQATHHVIHIDQELYQKQLDKCADYFNKPFQPSEIKKVVSFDGIVAPILLKPDLTDMKAFWKMYENTSGISKKSVNNTANPLEFNLSILKLHGTYSIQCYLSRRNPDEVCHTEVYALFKTDCAVSKLEIQKFLDRIQNELKIDESIKDRASRVICLITRYEQICSESGFVGYQDAETKCARQHIINALKPRVAKEKFR
ncbi:hypothetical protein THRCLA_22889 [Thraustotheca clavata]|uniref:Uncharacterized protein n=1 Tax=Thraustotheca clavata TaxID=74557 RepID=A0A1V9YS17_9STRA|nr:hypothetical protein THRCLA_22889 [Thraustotheca clavata]